MLALLAVAAAVQLRQGYIPAWPANPKPIAPSAAVPGVVVENNLAPTEVTDVCGGWAGVTKLNEVSQTCASWTVNQLRCMQVCHNTNRLQGFGQCMTDCTGGTLGSTIPEDLPTEELCGQGQEGIGKNTSDYCIDTVEKMRGCNCTLPETTGKPENFIECLDVCVFQCKKVLQLQLDLGFPIGWKPRKCPRDAFACTANLTCTKLPQCGPWDTEMCIEAECKPPVGRGKVHCYFDDPKCTPHEPEANETTPMCLMMPEPTPAPTPFNATEPLEADGEEGDAEAAADGGEGAADDAGGAGPAPAAPAALLQRSERLARSARTPRPAPHTVGETVQADTPVRALLRRFTR